MYEKDNFIIPRPALFYSHPSYPNLQYFGYSAKCLVHDTNQKTWGAVHFGNDYVSFLTLSDNNL